MPRPPSQAAQPFSTADREEETGGEDRSTQRLRDGLYFSFPLGAGAIPEDGARGGSGATLRRLERRASCADDHR